MRYYSIVTVLTFLRDQQTSNYSLVDTILSIFETDKTDSEKTEETHDLLDNSGMVDYMNVYQMEDVEFEENGQEDENNSNFFFLSEEEFSRMEIPDYKEVMNLGCMSFDLWLN